MQLFLRRVKYVKTGLEETKWKELSYQCMTEESGGESSEEIVRRHLPWRSEYELHWRNIHYLSTSIHYLSTNICLIQNCIPTDANNFIARLDRCRHRNQGKKGKFWEKHRFSSIPSSLPTPSGPKWSLRLEEALSETEMDSTVDVEEETSESKAFSDKCYPKYHL